MNKIRDARLLNGKTQAQVAMELGIERSSYARYENGTREPDIGTLILLADILQVSVDFLLGRTNDYHLHVDVIDKDAKRVVLTDKRKVLSEKEKAQIFEKAQNAIEGGKFIQISADSSNIDDLQKLAERLLPLVIQALEERKNDEENDTTDP